MAVALKVLAGGPTLMKLPKPKTKPTSSSSLPITGRVSAFTRSVGIFFSVSLSRTRAKGIVAHSSGGEIKPLSYTWPDKKKPWVCILGGRFGGLYTALRLESLAWPQVLLVDQSDWFVFKPLLYELLTGEVDAWEIAPLFTDLLKNTSVQFVKDRKVDNKLRMLEREHFFVDSSPIRVTIVGCGYSGVELAATISERLQNKGMVQAINVEKTICPSAPSGNREVALKVLQPRNIQLQLGYYVSCIKEVSNSDHGTTYSKYILEFQPAERGLESKILEADLVLWTVGFKPLVPKVEPFDQPHAIPLNVRGQAETDETLRVKGHPRILAIGNSAALRDSSGRLLPSTAQVAFQKQILLLGIFGQQLMTDHYCHSDENIKRRSGSAGIQNLQ